ncbi:MAG: GNAT family N-acetyltransferase [Paracoccaceae bacterium]
MTPSLLADVMEATWPAVRVWRVGPCLLRDGGGGGQRVSAASVAGDFSATDLDAALAELPQKLFVIYPGRSAAEAALDAALEDRGFARHDPVVAYAAPVEELAGDLPHLAAFAHWPPLEVVRQVWAEGGIGPARVQVMGRVGGPKVALMARSGDRCSGAAFVACHGDEAMVHALEVRPGLRRQGAGGHLLRAAANWAAEQGARRLSLVVTERNEAARALYLRAGMAEVGQYHYRKA